MPLLWRAARPAILEESGRPHATGVRASALRDMDHRKPSAAGTSEFRRKEPGRPVETPQARAKRLEREREMIEEPRQDIREGRYIPDEEVDDWLDRLAGDEPLPIPEGPRSPPLPEGEVDSAGPS